jgi:hypothetical protein
MKVIVSEKGRFAKKASLGRLPKEGSDSVQLFFVLAKGCRIVTTEFHGVRRSQVCLRGIGPPAPISKSLDVGMGNGLRIYGRSPQVRHLVPPKFCSTMTVSKGGNLMRVLMMVAAVALVGCATQGPQMAQDRYMQALDPFSGKMSAEFELASGDGCRMAQTELAKQHGLQDARNLIRCSTTSAASQLPYRMTIRVNSTQHLMDWHFLTFAGCEEIAATKKNMENVTLVAACNAK